MLTERRARHAAKMLPPAAAEVRLTAVVGHRNVTTQIAGSGNVVG